MLNFCSLNADSGFIENRKWWAYALWNGRVVGMVSVQDTGHEWLWVNDLFIEQGYRRKGIARKLIKYAEWKCGEVIDCNIAAFPAEVHSRIRGFACGIKPDNAASRALFESFGYRWAFTYPDSGALLYSKLLTRTSETLHST